LLLKLLGVGRALEGSWFPTEMEEAGGDEGTRSEDSPKSVEGGAGGGDEQEGRVGAEGKLEVAPERGLCG
jgi:hypothetical protein